MRESKLERVTRETQINLSLNLDGKGRAEIKTGCGFFDHMLTGFATHSRMDLALTCVGDLEVDAHHTVEDCGIALGSAIKEALGEKRGICRFGESTLCMDDALVMAVLDLSGRCGLYYEMELPVWKVGDFEVELAEEFFAALCRSLGLNLHLRKLAGRNTHHLLEAVFKSFGRAMRQAVKIDPELADEIPSSKGMLE